MEVYCTVCSRDKVKTYIPLNAVELYLGPHVKNIHGLSQGDGVGFRILSGKFGLLRAEDAIAWYDYLLTEDAVDELREKISNQISSQGISEMTFFAENREEHPNWNPYYDAIVRACEGAGIELRLKELDEEGFLKQ